MREGTAAMTGDEGARMTYGVIGVGRIAEAIVTGLCDGVAESPDVLLSPRNAEIAEGLARRYDTVTGAAGNHAVVDGAPVVLLCVRPQSAAEVLGELR
jgi:pyrroline-5-carboxylate reductase